MLFIMLKSIDYWRFWSDILACNTRDMNSKCSFKKKKVASFFFFFFFFFFAIILFAVIY